MPIAHGHKALRLKLRQRLLQCVCLGNGQLQKWRSTTQDGVVRAGLPQATAHNGPREEWPNEERHAQNGRIGKQVEQERADGLWSVRPTEVEQNDGNSRLHAPAPPAWRRVR